MTIQAFWDNNQGALTGWNRMLAAGTDIPAGSVVDSNGDVVAGVAIEVPVATVYNSGAGQIQTSGDAAWVTPYTHFGDWLTLSVVDTWIAHTITGLGSTPQTIELFGSNTSINRVLQGRVNGGTAQTLTITNNASNVLRFENIAPVDGAITIEVARHSTSVGGNAFLSAFRLFEYVAAQTMTVTTGDIQPGVAFNVLCENFASAPDETTFALNTLVDGIVVNSQALTVIVTDNLDGTYDIDGTMPALPASGSAAGSRFSDAGAGITHTLSVDPV